ncbi:MAG: carboxylating nicotinate-nucleotide diphosphorylase [Hyphomicrobiaceae bacterium]
MLNATLPNELVETAVADALAEDLGLAGDITTNAIIGPDWIATAEIVARESGRLAGLPLAKAAFHQMGDEISFLELVDDGDAFSSGTRIARIEGNARAILTGERVALNFLSRLSGVATLTRRFVDAVAGTNATIVDTRKTTPGHRAFEKYAVRAGGGMNHRVGLFDAVLIKDNHIAIAGGVGEAIAAARRELSHMVKVEVEVDTLEQLEEALKHKIDAVLLDNMSTRELGEAVAMCAGRIITEASGGINLETVRAIAETGVDLISVGALTHSAAILDFGLDSSVRKA